MLIVFLEFSARCENFCFMRKLITIYNLIIYYHNLLQHCAELGKKGFLYRYLVYILASALHVSGIYIDIKFNNKPLCSLE